MTTDYFGFWILDFGLAHAVRANSARLQRPHGNPKSKIQNPKFRRAFTLLEVLIALALLGALVAIVVPPLIDRLDERAFEAAADGTNEQLMMARAHAQATGEPVEVTYSPKTGQVQARVYAPWDAADSTGGGAIEPGTSPLVDRAQPPRGDSTSASKSTTPPGSDYRSHVSPSRRDATANLFALSGDDAHNRDIAEPWATRALGSGIRIDIHPPLIAGAPDDSSDMLCDPASANAVTDADTASNVGGQTLDDLEHGQDVRLAVFMPDGSAMVGENLWLNDGSGRLGRISINPWSGLPIFQRLADLTDEALKSSASQGDAAAHP